MEEVNANNHDYAVNLKVFPNDCTWDYDQWGTMKTIVDMMKYVEYPHDVEYPCGQFLAKLGQGGSVLTSYEVFHGANLKMKFHYKNVQHKGANMNNCLDSISKQVEKKIVDAISSNNDNFVVNVSVDEVNNHKTKH